MIYIHILYLKKNQMGNSSIKQGAETTFYIRMNWSYRIKGRGIKISHQTDLKE